MVPGDCSVPTVRNQAGPRPRMRATLARRLGVFHQSRRAFGAVDARGRANAAAERRYDPRKGPAPVDGFEECALLAVEVLVGALEDHHLDAFAPAHRLGLVHGPSVAARPRRRRTACEVFSMRDLIVGLLEDPRSLLAAAAGPPTPSDSPGIADQYLPVRGSGHRPAAHRRLTPGRAPSHRDRRGRDGPRARRAPPD